MGDVRGGGEGGQERVRRGEERAIVWRLKERVKGLEKECKPPQKGRSHHVFYLDKIICLQVKFSPSTPLLSLPLSLPLSLHPADLSEVSSSGLGRALESSRQT